MSAPDAVRVGMCVVRAEADPDSGLRITVTTRADVHRERDESVIRTAGIETALAQIGRFLASFERGET